ncbi:4-O-beta-D-mannosyl-D-glucose phosphorylase [Chitinophaga jiangningensis]|uniref:4-O-beta-D-mannosyl-D-glucose phosphorylase n=1 Tax=Chitinophaga jiangningensis TaxID=1419482 RepID=A0A1M6VKH1_9BACT|nr:glycosidase [Chitinophaga jiangningensis]SHK81990.1 4-O-beta-D-mannosyl-D-glucose phosphorylase [Chitinophaga jiangningensis]
MREEIFSQRLNELQHEQSALIQLVNEPILPGNGIFERYRYPVLTAAHTPLHWRYDLHPGRNPYLMERFGINATFNAGAIKWNNKYLMMVRVEGADRKSFFAIAESKDGIQQWEFRPAPVRIPETDSPDVNVYDVRLTAHEDGYIYGLFCTERKDPKAAPGDMSSAIAQCGIIRTSDMEQWERLPDLITSSPQQRNVVLHPEFVNGQYALYTRPQDNFIEAGSGGGIAIGYTKDMTQAVVTTETVIDPRHYHTVSELKNGQGPAPIKTTEGWLHLAHGVRNTAAGFRYVLYMFLTDLHDITKVTHKPAGYFMAPEGLERVGDVSNVLFSNGWIADEDGRVLIYYASSDTRMHVAVSSIDRLLDYVKNTAPDQFRSAASVDTVMAIIEANR